MSEQLASDPAIREEEGGIVLCGGIYHGIITPAPQDTRGLVIIRVVGPKNLPVAQWKRENTTIVLCRDEQEWKSELEEA